MILSGVIFTISCIPFLVFQLISHIIKEKFSTLISNVLENIFPVDDKNNCENIKGKWDYIPFKISFIGYPLSGRKTQAEILNKKYTHFKIYSVYDILKDKVKLWNEINEPLENNPKFKTMKPNQIDSLKEE